MLCSRKYDNLMHQCERLYVNVITIHLFIVFESNTDIIVNFCFMRGCEIIGICKIYLVTDDNVISYAHKCIKINKK